VAARIAAKLVKCLYINLEKKLKLKEFSGIFSVQKFIFALFLCVFAAYGQQQERVAIINTLDNLDSIHFTDLSYLTNKLRETAVNVLPKAKYGVMTTESIVAFLGSQENAIKICNEASCLAELGRKVSADYVAQARIGRFSGEFTINCELYNSRSGNLLGSFAGFAPNMKGLLAIIDENAPILFQKLTGVVTESTPQAPVLVPAPIPEPVHAPAPVVAYEPPAVQGGEHVESGSGDKNDKRAFSLGIRTGINFSHLYETYNGKSGSHHFAEGFQGEIVFDIAMNDWFYMQPGIMFIKKGANFNNREYELALYYFELPLLASFKLWVFRLNAGPYFSFGGNNAYGNLDMGLNLGGGFDIGSFYIGTFYDYGLQDISKKGYFQTYNRTLGFNLGYNI